MDSFPPANFIDSGTETFFDKCQMAIYFLSIGLLIVALLVIPRKYALHSLSIVWLPAYFYLTYFHSTASTNEWISSTLMNISSQAFKGGFSLGPCCTTDEYYETTSQLLSNMGIVLIAIILSWLTYGIAKVVDSCRDL